MRVPLDIPPGLVVDDTTFAAKGAWGDADKARFWRGRPQTIGGWESFIGTALTGTCRAVLPWTDNAALLNVGFGTHSSLQVAVGGVLYTITPTLALPSATLGTNPLAVVNLTPTVTVTHPGHGMATGDSVIISGAVAIGGITPNGTFTVTVVDVKTYTYTFGSNATSTVTGGGGTAVVATPQTAFAAGNVDGTGGLGYGTGSYSTGSYSAPSTGDYFPRTWALSNYGQTMVANPRGGPIYQWSNATGTPAAPLTNSPSKVTYALATIKRQIIAFGCNEQLSGSFNPLCIRGSDIANPTVWGVASTNNAFEDILEGAGRIVAARAIGSYIFVWTDNSLYLGTYLGNPNQIYRWDRVGQNCGLIGPNAVSIMGQTAYWLSTDAQFRACTLGGAPTIMVSPEQATVAANIASAQQDKITCATVSSFGEVWWFYPDGRDGVENSRYVVASTIDGSWSRGTFNRTAFVDAGFGGTLYPLGVDSTGLSFYHEKGASADGAAFAWYVESAAQYLGEADQMLRLSSIWPDFQSQVGPVSLTVYTRKYPQDTDRTVGPFALSPGQSKRDFRATGRLVRIRVSGNSSPTFARLGKPEFDTQPLGMQ